MSLGRHREGVGGWPLLLLLVGGRVDTTRWDVEYLWWCDGGATSISRFCSLIMSTIIHRIYIKHPWQNNLSIFVYFLRYFLLTTQASGSLIEEVVGGQSVLWRNWALFGPVSEWVVDQILLLTQSNWAFVLPDTGELYQFFWLTQSLNISTWMHLDVFVTHLHLKLFLVVMNLIISPSPRIQLHRDFR